MVIREIDINADLGEGSGNDSQIMPLISSCNIACGGHYGTDQSMRTAIGLAKKYNVKIGAHPSFPDIDNFGRKIVTLTKSELTGEIFNQILHFLSVCETEDATLNHIKLHGALYNYATIDAPTADAVVEGIIATKLRPILYVPYNSILAKKAENLLPLVYEAFIDRRYNNDLTLVSREYKGAVIDNMEQAWLQLKQMALESEVTTILNKKIPIVASTFCIHSDHLHSVEILKYIRSQMSNHNIELVR